MTQDMPGGSLSVVERAIYRGPHLYGRLPMIRIRLDLGALEDWPSDRIPGFNAALAAQLPGLEQHGCCYGEPGGFQRRLEAGTWLGHVIEHVALELQTRAGASVTRGKTRSVRGRPGVYDILYAYEDEIAGLLAGRLAIQIVDALLPVDLRGARGLGRLVSDGVVEGVRTAEAAGGPLRQAVRRGSFGPSTAALVAAARRRRIPVTRLNEQSLLQLGWGANQRRIRASVTDRTGLIATELAGDKSRAKAMLQAIGCPVARGVVVRSADEAWRAAGGLTLPVVLKPLDGNHGRGVTTELTDEAGVRAAFDLAVQHSARVIVEEHLPGRDHRVLVVAGKVVAVAERVPAHVAGDGRRTVAELVDQVNLDPRRGEGHEKVLTRIRLDEGALAILAQQGLTPNSVPEAGLFVPLRGAANLSTGGTAVDRTDDIHPDNASIARRAALTLGLDVAGVDLLAPDITRSIRETGGGIVEVNAAPGLRMHLEPSAGQARDVAEPIIRSLYPAGSRARIPVLAITGTNGKSTTGRMVAHILKADGRVVGLTNTSGVYIGDERIHAGDASGPKSARMVLRDPTVEAAVLECARGGVLREGLAFDRCDVGAVLNVQADHLGLGGIDTLQDLARVKAIVARTVSRRGVCVLNADDPLTRRMARLTKGRIAWFSMMGGRESPGFLRSHVEEGGLACVHDAATGALLLHDGGETTRLCDAADIPATLGGAARFNVANAMAAVLMTHAIGVAPETIRFALASFASTFEQNPGRLNIHDAHGFRVVLDYAHNPDGLRALARTARAITPPGGRRIAMLSIPGDRRDAEIVEMGAIAAADFDRIVFRETPDNRGRPAGEVIRLMTQGALSAGGSADRIEGVRFEAAAVDHCLAMARPGDVVVLTPTQIDSVWRQVLDFRPGAANDAGDPPAMIMEPPHG
ncbi:cyanophycin synthetase [Brevundimonas sp. PAMC22021]|uniref:cyanophycin synthetase n=1 Tax=Brevundimonas sp. PAMC22021 TaxID=2861285 RepID=UPI001C635B9E|nr:cyanophycin synthetase [Brevundimonas sp. PAMC22021]QYF87081.1 cyanophycin synthetase [Brevundimonas sp. PAMC22021]